VTSNVFPVYAREFIDRRPERAFFSERWLDAASGRGSFLLIEGDAGLGKTRLLEEFCGRADGVIARGACLPHADAPFAPIADVLNAVVREFPAAVPPPAYLRTVLRTLVPGITPPFEIVNSDSALVRRWMLDAIAETISRLSATKPALIAIEDLHWADADTLAAIAHVLGAIEHLRVVVVATYRPASGQARPGFEDFLTAALRSRITCLISLRELDGADARALVSSALPADARLSPLEIEHICTRAAGNPLFLEELLKHRLESGDDSTLPRTIDALLRQRLTALAADDLRVLSIAGTVPGEFEAGQIAAVSGLDPAAVADSLGRALRHNIVVMRGRESGRYAFRHHLTREITGAMLEPGAARSIHRALAERLETAIGGSADHAALAHHWLRAGDADRARPYAIRAGDDAAAACAYERAIEWYSCALASRPDDRAQAELNTKLARMFKNAGAVQEALEAAERAVLAYERLGDADALAGTLVSMSSLRAREWSERSLHDAERAIAATGADPANRFCFAAHVRIAETLFMRGRIDEARVHVDVAAPHTASAQPRHLALFHQIRSWLAFSEGDPRCVSMALEAIEQARAIGDVENLPGLCANAANMAMERGEPAVGGGGGAGAAAAEIASHYRLAAMETYARISYVDFLREYGTLHEAAARIRELGHAPLEARWLGASASSAALNVALATGDDALAAAWTDLDFLEVSRRSADATRFGPLAGAHAEAAARRGESGRAFELLDEAVRMMTDAHGNHETLLRIAMLGFAGRLPRAREVLAGTARRWNTARSRAYLALFDAFAADAPRERAELAHRAATQFEHVGCVLPLARALELAGDDGAARALYRECGALHHLALLDARAVNKPVLSKREGQIAGHIAEGLTNKEIAGRLGLSDRTVENHVASILRKLAVRSRTEVATYVVSASAKAAGSR
jgi:DNA-binding CsgD family transcriptional regulator/tetratricopeptide (TPR) repeat protein